MGRVIVVGAGVVGSAVARFLHARGESLIAVDVDAGALQPLEATGISTCTAMPRCGDGDVIVLSLPTPEVNGSYDLTALTTAADAVGTSIRSGTRDITVVQRSTVAPGTCLNVLTPLLEAVSGLTAGESLHVVANPEFLRAQHADHDIANPRMTVIGSPSGRGRAVVRTLFDVPGTPVSEHTDPTVAEFIKCAHNAYNAAKISFWNEMWLLARTFDVNADEVAEVVAQSAEASWNPMYGIRGGRAFDGDCLPKDLRALIGCGEQLGIDTHLLSAVAAVNSDLAEATADIYSAIALNRS